MFGGNEGLGNYSVGLGADVQQKYRVDLKYIDFVGRYKDNGTAVTAQNGLTTFLTGPGLRQPHLQDHLLKETTMKSTHRFALSLLVRRQRSQRRPPSRPTKPRPSAPR